MSETLVNLVVVEVKDGWVTLRSPIASDVPLTRTVETHRMLTGRDAKVGETYRFRRMTQLDGPPYFYYQPGGSFVNIEDERAAFLAAIFADPDDDTRRLAFADFLQERGDESRAAFIRFQCEVAKPGWGCQLCTGTGLRPGAGFCSCAKGRATALFEVSADDWSRVLPGAGNRELLRIFPERFEVVTLWDSDYDVVYTFRRGFAEISPNLLVECVKSGTSVWLAPTGPDGDRYDLTQLNPRELPFGTILSGISEEGTVRFRIRESGEEHDFLPHQFIRTLPSR